MPKHIWKHTILCSFALFLLTGFLVVAKQIDEQNRLEKRLAFAGEETIETVGQNSTSVLEDTHLGGNFTADESAFVWELFFGLTDTTLIEKLGKNCIVLSKEAAGSELYIKEEPITASLFITLPNGEDYLKNDCIYRVCSNNYYNRKPDEIEKTELATRLAPKKEIEQEGADVVCAVLQEKKDTAGITLTLALDTVYETILYEDEWYYYISLKRPRELYDKLVVLDAGHGGIDPGTSSLGYVHQEKETNLAVILYTKQLLDTRDDIKAYYTRTTDWKPSLEQRAALANALQTDLFISVHCNYNERKTVSGIEVLYNSAQNERLPFASKRLAQLCLEKLGQGIGLYERGIIDRKDNVYIVGHSEAPVALIELGYMSNTTDLAVLVKEESRRVAAQSLLEAIDAAFAEIEQNQ